MKAYREDEEKVKVHTFLTMVLDGCSTGQETEWTSEQILVRR
jgi:hypothetical protein